MVTMLTSLSLPSLTIMYAGFHLGGGRGAFAPPR